MRLDLPQLPVKIRQKSYSAPSTNAALWSPNEYIGLSHSLSSTMNLNLALVNAKRSSFDVSDVKFIYKKLGEKDRNANYGLLKII